MANANITHIQLVNTFNEWRAGTNDLIEDRNILRNSNYVKDGGALTLLSAAGQSNTPPLLTIGSTGNGNVFVSNLLTATRVNANTIYVDQDLTVNGNVFIEGDISSFNVATLSIEDNEIILNSNTTAAPTLSASITIDRGTSTNTFLRWNESTDKWGWSDDGTTMYNFQSALDAYGQANAAFNQANTARATANDAYGQANTARSDANTTFATMNTTFSTVNTNITNVNANGLNAYAQANAAYTQANNAYARANLSVTTLGGTFSGDVTIQGNLFVEGASTTFNVASLVVEDSETKQVYLL
jgi:hypothetical protein